MSRVIRWYEGSLAPAAHERPVVVGLEVVMVLAEPVQQIEQGELPSCPRVAMVGLESGRRDTAVRRARRVDPLEGRGLVGARPPPVVRDPEDLLALRHDRCQKSVT